MLMCFYTFLFTFLYLASWERLQALSARRVLDGVLEDAVNGTLKKTLEERLKEFILLDRQKYCRNQAELLQIYSFMNQ